MTLRNAIAQSINIPAIKVLYLAGLSDTLELAKSMGVTTLTNPSQYGLTLVLGGGEVTLLDMASAYGVFAQDGVKYQPTAILRIEKTPRQCYRGRLKAKRHTGSPQRRSRGDQ
jgi:membrane peptidoglycan carboxypeptidase